VPRSLSLGQTSTQIPSGAVHLRRALLLFAIVLGTAALVASLSGPIDQRKDTTTTEKPPEPGPAVAEPGPAAEAAKPLSFDAPKGQTKRLPAGRAATVLVSVAEPGDVSIPDLGLTEPAERDTPASFDVLVSSPGSYELTFMPASGAATEPAGKLVITSAE
jgi:hypothetical protein